MKSFTSKQARKQAEDSIIRDIRLINKKLEIAREKKELEVDREQVMSVLTRFVELKKASKLH
jgi:hypothetical protein